MHELVAEFGFTAQQVFPRKPIVKKVAHTGSTQAQGRAFVYAEDGSLLGEYPMEANPASPPTRGAQHIWLPTDSGPMPIAVVGEGRQYAVHADHLNTPRRLTQEDGKVAWQWAYSAFGDEQPTTAANRFTSESTNPSTGSTSVPQVQYSLRYPGQYFDEESGLHYNWHRTYDPKNGGRYTQADPIGLDGGANRFAYVGGNPLSFIDPLGLCKCENVLSQAEILNNDRRYQFTSSDRPGPNTNKCNFFVDDVLESTGVAPRRNILGMPISAGTWADPRAKIPNFPVVTDPRPGDIVAMAHRTPDSLGHVAIVQIPGISTIGTGTTSGSHVTGWPWDPDTYPQGTPIYRRCTCQK